MNRIDVTGPIAVPETGSWQTWVTVARAGVPLAAGPQVLRLAMDTVGNCGAVGNFNWIRIIPDSSRESTPYAGTRATNLLN